MLSVSEKLEAAATKAKECSVGDKKGGCALCSRDGKIYSGFSCFLDENLTIEPVDMALSLALGDGCVRFTAAYLCGDAFNLSSLKRLSRFGDLLIGIEKAGNKSTTTLKKLILSAGE